MVNLLDFVSKDRSKKKILRNLLRDNEIENTSHAEFIEILSVHLSLYLCMNVGQKSTEIHRNCLKLVQKMIKKHIKIL